MLYICSLYSLINLIVPFSLSAPSVFLWKCLRSLLWRKKKSFSFFRVMLAEWASLLAVRPLWHPGAELVWRGLERAFLQKWALFYTDFKWELCMFEKIKNTQNFLKKNWNFWILFLKIWNWIFETFEKNTQNSWQAKEVGCEGGCQWKRSCSSCHTGVTGEKWGKYTGRTEPASPPQLPPRTALVVVHCGGL